MRQMSVWDMMVLLGFAAAVAGLALLYSVPLAAVVAGCLLMFAGIVGARGRGPEKTPPAGGG
jgi:hypothetical protein